MYFWPLPGALATPGTVSNFPEALSAPERAQWAEHCADWLCQGEAGGRLALPEFGERLDALQAAAGERERTLLAGLRDYARRIRPDCSDGAAAPG